MRIGIDIDDTITDSTIALRNYIRNNNFDNKEELLSKEEDIIRGYLKDEKMKEFFHNNSLLVSETITIKENAKEIIDKLHEEGNEIIIITARSDNYYKNAQEYCTNFLHKHNIYFDKLITGQTYKDKTCQNEHIDIMIDDAIDTCEDVRKRGINSLVFNSEINKDRITTCNRVDSWIEVYNYIHNLKN